MSRVALMTRTLAAKAEGVLRAAGAVPGVEGYPGVPGFRIDAPEPVPLEGRAPPTLARVQVRYCGPADADWTAPVAGYHAALVAAGLPATLVPAHLTVERRPYVTLLRRVRP